MATELTVSWIFDVISPFAYLGVKQLPPPPARPFNPLAALRLIITGQRHARAAATIMSISANSLYRRRAMVRGHL